MRLIESGMVRTLIVKDLSRLGREYLEVGKLTELVFPSYGVRFIAINDNVDSFYGENDFVPFKNLFNEFYAKDTSRKIRAVKKAQAQRGERLATRPRYGYRKADGDPKKIVRDPQAADVVQKIFLLCASGKGPSQIARLLKREQILNPSNYYFKKYGVALTGLDTTRPFEWSETTVAKILEDEIYLGHTISLRYTTQSYKNKRRIERPETEWLRFEDAQPGRVVLEGDLHAVHRQITKNNEIDDRRDQKQVKALALVELCEHPPAPLPAARPLFGACPCRCGRPAALQHFNHFFHRPSFGFVFIVQPKTRFCHVQKLTSAAIFAQIHP